MEEYGGSHQREMMVAEKTGCGGRTPHQKGKRPESQCPMHSNGRANSSRFACICVTKIDCASSPGNWMMKALQLGLLAGD